jgi:hypothetical protein
MSTLEERINKLMNKNVEAKTILVKVEERDEVINNYQNEGWKLVKESQLNGRYKLTFERSK